MCSKLCITSVSLSQCENVDIFIAPRFARKGDKMSYKTLVFTEPMLDVQTMETDISYIVSSAFPDSSNV